MLILNYPNLYSFVDNPSGKAYNGDTDIHPKRKESKTCIVRNVVPSFLPKVPNVKNVAQKSLRIWLNRQLLPEAQEATANNTNNSTALSTPVQKHQTSTLKTKLTVWCWLAIVSLCCGAFTLYKGFDKMFRYDSGDSYPHKYVNAYVGGDAYNYIINGTYATAYFVLTAMFVLAAIGLVIIHYLSKREVK